MKIIELQVENLKRVTAVNIKPRGSMVEIAGKNGAGKTSVLDAIWYALAGTKHLCPEPIHGDADEAKIVLDLGEYVVKRTFTRKADRDPPFTTSLRVESADGGSLKQPQTILDSFLGALTFDPLEFLRMDAKAQFDALRSFVPEIDFDRLDGQQRKDMEDRREINRQADQAASAASVIDAPADFTPIDETDLLDQMEKASTHNAELAARRQRRQAVEEEANRDSQSAAAKRTRVAQLREDADRLEREASELEEAVIEARERLSTAPALPDEIDVSTVRAQLNDAKAHNARGARAEEKKRLLAQAAELKSKSEALTAAIAQREAGKRAAIAKAKLPVEGLTFGEGRILLDGHPFEQASDAQQLRVSIAIAMATNSRLRVVRVRDGSLLDDDAMKLLADMAAKNDCQVWVERVGGAGPSGFVIEDGRVKS